MIESTTRYLYDGLLPIAELDGNNQVTRHITRGLDVSGSMQGAGGIGGILAITQDNQTGYPFADGNGNISHIHSPTDEVLASYQYDPYGNKLTQTGPWQNQPYQWSSKEHHQASGLVYYLYRFYTPDHGRWLNRDPIEERGGVNLYQALKNDPSIRLDPLGNSSVLPWVTTDLLTPEPTDAIPRKWVAYGVILTGEVIIMDAILENAKKPKRKERDCLLECVTSLSIIKGQGQFTGREAEFSFSVRVGINRQMVKVRRGGGGMARLRWVESEANGRLPSVYSDFLNRKNRDTVTITDHPKLMDPSVFGPWTGRNLSAPWKGTITLRDNPRAILPNPRALKIDITFTNPAKCKYKRVSTSVLHRTGEIGGKRVNILDSSPASYR
jgi:RHS repeat-associated protein